MRAVPPRAGRAEVHLSALLRKRSRLHARWARRPAVTSPSPRAARVRTADSHTTLQRCSSSTTLPLPPSIHPHKCQPQTFTPQSLELNWAPAARAKNVAVPFWKKKKKKTRKRFKSTFLHFASDYDQITRFILTWRWSWCYSYTTPLFARVFQARRWRWHLYEMWSFLTFLIMQQSFSSHAGKDKPGYFNPCHDRFLIPKQLVVMPKPNHTTHLGEMSRKASAVSTHPWFCRNVQYQHFFLEAWSLLPVKFKHSRMAFKVCSRIDNLSDKSSWMHFFKGLISPYLTNHLKHLA